MNRFLICISTLLIIVSHLFGQGFIVDYDVEGMSIGQTKIIGNLKYVCKAKSKRITGNLFIQEAGNPFPDLDERDLLIDFNTGKKFFFTTGSDKWVKSMLSDDALLVDENSIKVTIKEESTKVIAEMELPADPVFGGSQKYIIELVYVENSPAKEMSEFKSYGQPSAVEFLSIFLENEKLAEVLNNNLGLHKNRVPDMFTIKSIQDGDVSLKIDGVLQAKLNIRPPDNAFKIR